MSHSVKLIKTPLTLAGVSSLFLFSNVAYAAASTCPNFLNPIVVNGNCAEIYLFSSKSSYIINNGVTVSDTAPNGTTGVFAPGQNAAAATISLFGGTPIIDSFINNGTIIASLATQYLLSDDVTVLAQRPPALSVGGSTTINTLINNGSISSSPNGAGSPPATMDVWGTVGTFTNNGTITSTGTSKGLLVEAGGSIGTLNNYGTISGGGGAVGINVDASGSIGTLNNAQSGLAYSGKLPTNYNTFINSPTSYGKLNATSVSGQIIYGIAPGSTVGNTTYTGVLSGVTAANIANTTGTFGGGLVATNWRLTNSSGTLWDLATGSASVVTPNTGSNSGNKLGTAITFAYASAAAATVAPVLANGTSLVAAVQSLTPSQANTLSNVHAEGYSSNLTINLEQMGHVTNTIMDRIHAPLSGKSGTSTAFEVDQGRYIWVDASTMKGTVDSYNNLAGFGYRLSSLIMGGDLFRDASGGFGVFGGVGYTTMNEPEQVAQNFRTTNYYLGLYGGKYLPNNFKLSGAVGYVFSDSTAMRDNPNVGHFTGGQATSEYQSNGAYGAVKLSRPYLVSERVTITPFAGASYSQLWMKQANESGGNDFNYSISATSGRSALTFVGGEFLMPLSNGTMTPLSLIGFYRFGYDWYANKDSAHEITANSTLFGSFTQVGANKGPANNLMGLGLQGNIAKGVSIRAGIVGRISTYGTELGGGGEIKWEL